VQHDSEDDEGARKRRRRLKAQSCMDAADEADDDLDCALADEESYHRERAQWETEQAWQDDAMSAFAEQQAPPPADDHGSPDVALNAEGQHMNEEAASSTGLEALSLPSCAAWPDNIPPDRPRRARLLAPEAAPPAKVQRRAVAAALAYEASEAYVEDTMRAATERSASSGGVSVANPGLANRLGSGHALAEHRGALWCWKCGGWSKTARSGGAVRAKALTAACRLPTSAGLAVLSRLRRGLPPEEKSKAKGRWPDDEAEARRAMDTG
jgi:hypothetical protein